MLLNMVRAPCGGERTELRKGTWTQEEDTKLIAHIQKYGHSNWRELPKQAGFIQPGPSTGDPQDVWHPLGLLRCGKSCRLRWLNYLRPDIKLGNYTREEEEMIITLHGLLGNKWSAIAARLPGRTDNEIKNYWHTYLKKRIHKSHGSTRKSMEVSKSNPTTNLDQINQDEPRLELSDCFPSSPPDSSSNSSSFRQNDEPKWERSTVSDVTFWSEAFVVESFGNGEDSQAAYGDWGSEIPLSPVLQMEPLYSDAYMDHLFII